MPNKHPYTLHSHAAPHTQPCTSSPIFTAWCTRLNQKRLNVRRAQLGILMRPSSLRFSQEHTQAANSAQQPSDEGESHTQLGTCTHADQTSVSAHRRERLKSAQHGASQCLRMSRPRWLWAWCLRICCAAWTHGPYRDPMPA